MVEILYDDDLIQVLWRPGNGRYLLITFGDLTIKADGVRFFASKPVEKLDIPCLGFVAHSPNWYPSESMTKGIDAARTILAAYAERVVYGGSMGGYAAIKYSAALNAETVIALCPQYSIDPRDCEGHNSWRSFFRESMFGMSIRSADISGRQYVFFDPHSRVDSFHADKIQSVSSNSTLISIPYVGHHVTPTFAGTATLSSLISACRNNDMKAIRKLARNQRRGSRFRVEKILKYAAENRSLHCVNLLFKILSDEPSHVAYLQCGDLCKLINRVKISGDIEKKLSYIVSAFISYSTDPLGMLFVGMQMSYRFKKRLRLMTAQNTELFFDPGLGKLVHAKSLESEGGFPLGFEICGSEVRIFVGFGMHRVHLQADVNSEITSRYSNVSGDLTFSMLVSKPGHFSLSSGGRYLVSEKAKRMQLGEQLLLLTGEFRFALQ